MTGPSYVAARDFETFGPPHLVVLAIFVLGAVGMVAVGRAQPGTDPAGRFSKGFALLIPVITVPQQVLQFLPDEWDVNTSLPLQICDLAWVVAVIALWTRRRWAAALNYFWGITLSMQAILTPDLASNFPEPRFLMFWAMHLLIVWSAFYLAWGLRIVPSWREYRIAVVVTLVWAVGAFSFNAVTGTNYGYLNGKPDRGSALDLLGPWPLYVVLEIAIVLAAWALMTWPWVRADSKRGQWVTRT